MAFLQTAAKAIAAGVVALIGLLNALFGFDIGVDEATVNSILFAVITLIVAFFPNLKDKATKPDEPEVQ
jgi:hypothetical protein